MKPIQTMACNITFVAEGCIDLPAVRNEEDGFVATYWQPTPEELNDLNAGFPVRITIQCPALYPMMVDTEAL